MNKPIIDTPTGTYTKTCIISITSELNAKIFYSIDDSFPSKPYLGPFAIRNSAKVKAISVQSGEQSEISESDITIQKTGEIKKGCIFIIGGAEHCKEIHKKMVECVGGPQQAGIAFLPTSSRDPYAAGIDRKTRFSELADVNIDENLVPDLNGKKDYSSLQNNSRFWIMPIAMMDDENTAPRVEDNDDAPLAHESSFPDIDESKWAQNAYHKDIAEKLRDGNYNIIFMTGGNQGRYMECLYYNDYTESPVLTIMREIYEERGGVIAGTSAGAAVLSQTMILGGGSYGATMQGVVHQDIDLVNFDDNYTPFTDISDGRVWIGKGMGFLPNHLISGTHFVARGRMGRLLTAALYLKENQHVSVAGIGVDEDTAVCVYPNNEMEVVGALGVLVIETSQTQNISGSAQKGHYHENNVRLHYLEHQDVFSINEKGEFQLIKINQNKSKIESPGVKSFAIEPDIFGGNTIKNYLFKNLINNSCNECLGTEIIDNTETSYDSTLFHDLVKDDTVLLRFTKNTITAGFIGNITYSWWGSGDRDYPHLKTETETERFSFVNVNVDIMPVDVLNFPDMSDASNIDLLSDYIKDGRSYEEWHQMFQDYCTFRLGMLKLPAVDGKAEIRTFFFDYAYNDLDGNGYYSPPRMMNYNKGGKCKDYDIVEINIAENAEIFIDGNLVGTTDEHGLLEYDVPASFNEIKAVYKGKNNDYEVIYSHNKSNKETVLIFENDPRRY